ncbi:quinohemoprotein amine dehydrogenase subunit alpha [Zestomonas thermotolerans]|uniref:quinohemoprotein amine dehydrogenase subunit alpha n=1 Tax=Zestomonas thermotolerans TaxID=157784 RepID=UPI000378515D|nr:quinohemoprotein amine dehydrogenase subunit alpha [Pseudomonas thermotolerans]
MTAFGVLQPALAADGKALLEAKCKVCHLPDDNGVQRRIGYQRKTPEGWLMTIARMQIMHGLEISDDDRRTLVKYLADTQGLAPAEAEGLRYAMERRLNTIEEFDTQSKEMCGRCHSPSRFALQRRTAKEWEHLVHFHLGQWPSLEYQAMSRDRDWLELALKEMVPTLAERYGLDDPAWSKWQQERPAPTALVGRWSFSGHMPTRGDLHGVMSVEGGEGDNFRISLDGRYADGKPFKGKGSAILFTGHEWRANVEIDGVAMRQVFSVVNGEMKGRMFETEHDERGLDFVAAKSDQARLLAVQPEFLKAGEEAELTLVGSGLSGKPDFGPGVQLVKVLEQSPERLVVKVRAAADAAPGSREVKLGKLSGPSLAVYKRIDEVKVVPGYAIARIGDNGGATPKVQGRFEAEGWATDAAGKAYRVGILPASWSVEPFNERAAEDEDVKFAGVMQKDGVFLPGDAGPNPARRMSTNNAGNLKVIAEVEDGGQTLKGEGQLIVTVQRWNNPPLP